MEKVRHLKYSAYRPVSVQTTFASNELMIVGEAGALMNMNNLG